MLARVAPTEFEPTPATTGRPAAWRIATSSTRRFSSSESVGVSPVVPSGTRKSTPVVTCQSTVAAKAS